MLGGDQERARRGAAGRKLSSQDSQSLLRRHLVVLRRCLGCGIWGLGFIGLGV